MTHGGINLDERFSLFTEQWKPKVVARLNDYEIKIVRIQGEFVWHTHDDTDELFLVLAGRAHHPAPRPRGQCSDRARCSSCRAG